MKRRIAAWAGMIGPAIFVAVFTIEGLLRPNYDPLTMYVSELSIGPRGWIQILNFVVFGLLFLMFARGIAAEFREGKAAKAGPAILLIIGACLIASGIFVTDPATTARADWSTHGAVHQFIGALAFTLMPVSCFVFWRRFREDQKWRAFARWTFAAGSIVILMIVLMKIAQLGPLSSLAGLLQRIMLIVYFGWTFAFALALEGNRGERSAI